MCIGALRREEGDRPSGLAHRAVLARRVVSPRYTVKLFTDAAGDRVISSSHE